MNFASQKIVQCSVCNKDFLYFGGSTSEDETYFCSPDCTEKSQKF